MKTIRIIALLCVSAVSAWAQQQTRERDTYSAYSPYNEYVTFNASLHYGIGLPFGTQADYLNKTTTANAVVQFDWMFPARFSLGLKSGYQYDQRRLPRQVFQFGDESVSAVQTRTLTVIPVLATASYYFADNTAALRPYVQLGGGGAFVDNSTFYGTLVDRQSGFRGAIAPAIGVKFYGKRDGNIGGEIQAQYQYIAHKDPTFSKLQGLLISAGLTFRWF